MAKTATADPPQKAAPRRRGLLPVLAAVALAGGGFASTYLGYWSPVTLARDLAGLQKASHGESVFVDVPTIEMNLPGSARELTLLVSIETDASHEKRIIHLMPRLRDAFTVFLSGIDAAAYDKRGVLEIIRAELKTRARLVLGDQIAKDLLITEYRIR